MIGNGKRGMCCARLVVTGNSGNIPTAFTTMNKINFPTLTFTPQFDGILAFDENTGIFRLLHEGFLWMSATLNLQASQAFATINIVPEFNDDIQNPNWVVGAGKKVVMSAIVPSQIDLSGLRQLKKDTQIRFWFAATNGNVTFQTEILDPGGLNCPVPAAVFYLQWHPCRESLVV